MMPACESRNLDGIAVTSAPGLVGALLVGVMYGKTLAWSLDLPLIGVHHLEGHLFAATLEDPTVSPPFVALLVSGGHTMLLDVPAWGQYRLLGQTIDDAAGEAFDKVAKLLGLGYPGGPHIERLAREGRAGRFKFPRPMLREMDRPGPQQYAFSFSGLKTAVLRAVQQSRDLDADRADLALAFQDAALDVLVEKTAHAVDVAGLRHRRDRWRRRVQPGAGGADAGAGGTGARRGRVATTQYRQCRDDRGRWCMAARAR